MITRFLTSVTTKFNPFSPSAKTARIFLSLLPPNARQMGMKINTTLLPRNSKEPSVLLLKFSALLPSIYCPGVRLLNMVIFCRIQRMGRKCPSMQKN